MEEHLHNTGSRGTTSTTQTSGHRNLTSNASNHALNRKVMLCTVVLLIVAISIMVCFQIYSRWLFGRRRRSADRRAVLQASAGEHSGLSLSILKALPTFVYLGVDRSATALECSVCLSEFEYKEEGRELPKCKHIFHLECIDMWFGSHSTCPLCRAPVELELDNGDAKKCEAGGSSSGSGELVGVLVELPPVTREEAERRSRGSLLGSGSGLGPPFQHCFTPKSPGDRAFTMKSMGSVQ